MLFFICFRLERGDLNAHQRVRILKSFFKIVNSVDGKVEKGWRCSEDGRQRFTGSPAIPPNGFIVKDSQMGTLHIFPGPRAPRRSAETILVGIRPRKIWPWVAGIREWIRFGKRRGRSSWLCDAGAPILIMNSCYATLCPGYGRGTNAPPAEISPKPTLTLRSCSNPAHCSANNQSMKHIGDIYTWFLDARECLAVSWWTWLLYLQSFSSRPIKY